MNRFAEATTLSPSHTGVWKRGLTQVAGAAFIGLAAASAEIGISVVSAVRGVGDIGMAASLGANTLAISRFLRCFEDPGADVRNGYQGEQRSERPWSTGQAA